MVGNKFALVSLFLLARKHSPYNSALYIFFIHPLYMSEPLKHPFLYLNHYIFFHTAAAQRSLISHYSAIFASESLQPYFYKLSSPFILLSCVFCQCRHCLPYIGIVLKAHKQVRGANLKIALGFN